MSESLESASSDDLYTALALVESGFFAEATTALAFAQTLATHDFVEGVTFRSTDLRAQLAKAGRDYFERVFASIRELLCAGEAVRISSRVGADLVFVVIEIVTAHTGIAVPIASLFARIVVAEGLERLCRG